MLTREDRHWHDHYEAMPDAERAAVDAAFTAARRSLLISGLKVSNSDPAEALVAAIARYVEESRR